MLIFSPAGSRDLAGLESYRGHSGKELARSYIFRVREGIAGRGDEHGHGYASTAEGDVTGKWPITGASCRSIGKDGAVHQR